MNVLLDELVAERIELRLRAAERLYASVSADRDLLRHRRVQETIVAALRLENSAVRRNLDTVLRGDPPLFGEEFGEHYASVLRLADMLRSIDSLNPERRAGLLRELVLGSYNSDSPFARDLAEEGEPLVPHVLEAVGSSSGPKRWNGYELIALLFARSETGTMKSPLSPASQMALRAAARAGLQDPAASVRRHAVTAVLAARDRSAVPLLRFLAETDPDINNVNSVRSRAAAAAEALQRLR